MMTRDDVLKMIDIMLSKASASLNSGTPEKDKLINLIIDKGLQLRLLFQNNPINEEYAHSLIHDLMDFREALSNWKESTNEPLV